ncbi:hypothetical protein Pint_23453 [Pistacia integerrima]|uniref:Uncharacterized protein n=1 Tax=Pistacia integerrima TaxID=434235 RepID=A0ACC0YN69_9ROSI|nr:hypothetical protein Pint_23453 [Pistacia integerrima]
MEAMIIYLSSCVCLLLLSVLIKFIHKFWWTPICIQSKMMPQGIKGPSYKFIYGNTKEIIHMRNEIMATPMELSNHILPRIEPHVHSWTKLYGKNFLFWYGPKPQLVVTEPDLIKQILNDKEDGIYRKRDLTYFAKKLLGDGLASARGEKWFRQRKIANHAFHAENLKVNACILVNDRCSTQLY